MGECGALGLESEQQREIEERCLTEVDNLNRLRLPDGHHDPAMVEATHINLLTAVKEAAMPYAVSTTYQEYRDGTFWWLDQTPVQVAESGYKFHKHPAALERVDVEIDEARDTETNLRPGFIKVFISPKMSEADAPYDIAKQEHLGDDDMIRIHMLDTDDTGKPQGKFMQSILVRDVPLEAWVAMLQDPGNIFGAPIALEDESSALSVMKVHKQLEVPEAALPEGTISLVEAVVPYISDKEMQCKVREQLVLFRDDQDGLHKKAEHIADRWLSFEISLADSLRQERATPEIEAFIFQLQHQWAADMLHMLEAHTLPDGGFCMSRELAVKIEKAKQNTLWTAAGVITGNQEVLGQLDDQTAKAIYDNEMHIQTMMHQGYGADAIARLEIMNNQAIAQSNVSVGAGCAGKNEASFGGSEPGATGGDAQSGADGAAAGGTSGSQEENGKDSWKWKSGVCRIAKCPTRPNSTSVGPCEVCRGCQRIFDNGSDPNTHYSYRKIKEPASEKPIAAQVDQALAERANPSEEREDTAVKAGSLAVAAG